MSILRQHLLDAGDEAVGAVVRRALGQLHPEAELTLGKRRDQVEAEGRDEVARAGEKEKGQRHHRPAGPERPARSRG